MIRGVAFFLALCFASVSPAFSEATYFLVDNSGSMTQYREGEKGVDREVEGLVRQSSAGSEFYIAYFRGKTESDCESPVSLPNEPVLASSSFDLDPGRAGGSTLIVRAISALYGIDDQSDADVVLYTDGSFGDSVCETSQQICEALLELRRDRPRLKFRFEAPKAMRDRGEPVLSCAGLTLHDRSGEASGGDEIGDRGDGADEEVQSARIVWPPLVALLVLPLLLIAPFVINILSIRRFTVDIETADKVFDPNKKLTPKEIWAYWTSGIIVALVIGVIVAYYVMVPGARDTHVLWYDAANKPLLSIVYAYAFTVVLGWYFVERMRDSHARKQNEWKLSYNESVRQFEVSEVSRIHGVFANARRDQDEYERRLIGEARSRVEVEDGDAAESIQTRILNLSNHVQGIKSRIDRALGEVTTYQEVQKYQNASFSDYDSIAELLLESGKIDEDLSCGIKRLFVDWSNLLQQLPRIEARLEQAILEFDISVFDAETKPQEKA